MSLFPNVKFLLSVAAPSQLPPDNGVDIAMAGRSNAGKSSAINAILSHGGLARTSKTPGRTQMLNYFELLPGRRMVDLPGYGHAKVPGEIRVKWGPLIDSLRTRACFKGLMVVVDIRRGLLPEDVALLEWSGLPPEGLHVLLSKADKLSRGQGLQVLRDVKAQLAGMASVSLLSSLKKTGLDEARGVLKRWCAEG